MVKENEAKLFSGQCEKFSAVVSVIHLRMRDTVGCCGDMLTLKVVFFQVVVNVFSIKMLPPVQELHSQFPGTQKDLTF